MAELHFDASKNLDSGTGPWWRGMTGYHWFVLLVAALGWMFDTMDQQFFVLGRPAAMKELLRGITPEQFADFSGSVKKSLLPGIDAVVVDAFLQDVDAKLAKIERRKFWPMARTLNAQLKQASDAAAVSQAVAGAQASFKTATDDKEFETTVNKFSSYATAIFLLGWATGGLIFGVLGDRIGRAKTMLITILMYSIFTGMCSFSVGFWDFAVYRFLTDMGVGGEFAVGVSLVAEVMPSRARAPMLTLLQMLSTVGNMTAAIINMRLGVMEEQGLETSPWRIMFMIGALPALLALLIRWKLKEPERWKQLSTEAAFQKQLGSYGTLFGDPRWRRNALVGLALALSGVVGLWAVGFFTPDLVGQVLRNKLTVSTLDDQLADAKGDPQATADLLSVTHDLHEASLQQKKDSQLAPALAQLLEKWRQDGTPAASSSDETRIKVSKAIDGRVTYWRGVGSISFQIGAFLGMFSFGFVAQKIGRKPTFAIALLGAFVTTAVEFTLLDSFAELFWIVPLVGFFQLSLFAGYAVYFPELFPTSLRSTGTSFCYNVGRFLAVPMLLLRGELSAVFANTPEPIRYAGLAMCSVFLIGLFALPFAPETKDKPLPE